MPGHCTTLCCCWLCDWLDVVGSEGLVDLLACRGGCWDGIGWCKRWLVTKAKVCVTLHAQMSCLANHGVLGFEVLS